MKLEWATRSHIEIGGKKLDGRTRLSKRMRALTGRTKAFKLSMKGADGEIHNYLGVVVQEATRSLTAQLIREGRNELRSKAFPQPPPSLRRLLRRDD